MTALPIRLDPVFGCELWEGELSEAGYGKLEGRGAHRVLYVRRHGPLEPGLVLDHLCRRRACTADHHLEPVTARENELRKSFPYRIKRVRCPRGHELALTKIVTPEGPRRGEGGGVVCRQCNRDALAAKETDAASGTDRTARQTIEQGDGHAPRDPDRVSRDTGGAPRDPDDD